MAARLRLCLGAVTPAFCGRRGDWRRTGVREGLPPHKEQNNDEGLAQLLNRSAASHGNKIPPILQEGPPRQAHQNPP
ncbi:hypothetical protein XENTR_v10022772 [Xenopus tropicalis]|nr:hypothetical protein XENTR_v10022772 [Xenopus tropicalis]